MTRGLLAGVLGLALWPAAPTDTLAAAGRIVFKVGNVAVRDADGRSRDARRGTEIDAGQTVVTRQGRAHIRFTDGGQISLIPDTVFRVDEYRYQGRADGSESALLRLVRGGLRAVTGAIGRARKSAYRLRSPVATIGIRGTSFQARLCQGDCPGRPDGLYVQGGTGTVFVENDAGTLDVTGGQAVFVADAALPPVFTTVEPDVAAPGVTAVAAVETDTDGEDAPEFAFEQIVFRERQTIVATANRVVRTIAPGSGGVAAAGEGFQTTLVFDGEPFSGNGVIEPGSVAAAGFIAPDESITFGLDASDGVIQITASDLGAGRSAVASISNVEDAGSDGILFWGRWANADVTIEVTTNAGPQSEVISFRDPKALHYVLGQPVATLPGAGIATYGFLGGTRSTSGILVGNGVTSGTLTANFATRTVGAVMTVNHGTDFLVNVPNMPVANSGSFEGNGVATGGCAMCAAEVDGFFAGSGGAAPPRAGVAYEIQNPGDAIHGAAAFRCTSGC